MVLPGMLSASDTCFKVFSFLKGKILLFCLLFLFHFSICGYPVSSPVSYIRYEAPKLLICKSLEQEESNPDLKEREAVTDSDLRMAWPLHQPSAV